MIRKIFRRKAEEEGGRPKWLPLSICGSPCVDDVCDAFLLKLDVASTATPLSC